MRPVAFTSSSVDEDVGFWIHEAAKSLTLADGTSWSFTGSMTAGSARLAAMYPT